MRPGTLFRNPIIVHSHLSWNWVWQRPQQFLSRLSRQHRILFVETYSSDTAETRAEIEAASGYPNITLLRVHLPSSRWQDGAYIDRERRRIVQDVLHGRLAGRFDNPVQWFYDPMAFTAFAGHLGERLIVYDCMDELSKFKAAPPCIVDRERQLLAAAHVVFTGGRKMHREKSLYNPNCHFYGCGVDSEHFGQARAAAKARVREAASLTRPVFGYFGVIDERIDYELLARLADGCRSASIVMVGPSAKVDPAEFPQRRNLHWLGGREYRNLPAYAREFDVCLMPFALNEATEFINPTKALEYMATGRPIISSALEEVAANFGKVVKIAGSHDEFLQLCLQEAARPDAAAIRRGLAMAAENSWDSIVAKLEQHLNEALLGSLLGADDRKQPEVRSRVPHGANQSPAGESPRTITR